MLTHAEVERILTSYDLGQLRSMTTATRGYVNETAFIHTTEGRFVLRRSHRRLNEEQQRYRHTLIEWLYQHDFPVPPLIPAKNGDTLQVQQGRYIEVMQFVSGGDFDQDNASHLWSVGQVLAQMHNLLEDYPKPPDNAHPRYIPENALRLIEIVLERDVMGDLAEPLSWYDRRAARLRKVLSEEAYSTLPKVVIHGDVHRDNFLFSKSDITAVLDYDQVSWQSPIADLADALVAFASEPKTKGLVNTWGVFTGPLSSEHALEVITAYHSVRPLSTSDLTTLLNTLEVIWLHGELGRVVSTPEGAPEYHEAVLGQGRQLLDDLDRKRDALLTEWQQQCAELDVAEPVAA